MAGTTLAYLAFDKQCLPTVIVIGFGGRLEQFWPGFYFKLQGVSGPGELLAFE